jgi:hypothetical protein
MNIWTEHIQRFPSLDAKAVFFIANEKAIRESTFMSMRAAADATAGVTTAKRAMFKFMGDANYCMAVIDLTRCADELEIRVIAMPDSHFSTFMAWMRREFPFVEHRPTDRTTGNPDDCWLILRDADYIKFRYMFPYQK